MKPESIARIMAINSAHQKAAHGQASDGKNGKDGKDVASDALDQVGRLLTVDMAKMRAAHEAGEPVLADWGYALAAAAIRVAENAPKPQQQPKKEAQ